MNTNSLEFSSNDTDAIPYYKKTLDIHRSIDFTYSTFLANKFITICVYTHFSGQINEQTAVTITLNMHIYPLQNNLNFELPHIKEKVKIEQINI